MPKRFDLLVFDWDGTLMDSAACIANALQCACQDLGFAIPSERDARYVIGLGLNDALAHVLPGIASSEYPRVVERYRHHFVLGDARTGLFTGVSEMVRELRQSGHLLAIATGKSRRGLTGSAGTVNSNSSGTPLTLRATFPVNRSSSAIFPPGRAGSDIQSLSVDVEVLRILRDRPDREEGQRAVIFGRGDLSFLV